MTRAVTVAAATKEYLSAGPNFHKITQGILPYINGGWEIWLQVELGLYFIGYPGDNRALKGIVHREKPYPVPNANKKCDFMIEPDRGTYIWIELKTQWN